MMCLPKNHPNKNSPLYPGAPYSNSDATENLLNYVTGSGRNIDKQEVIYVNVWGCSDEMSCAVYQMQKIQRLYDRNREKKIRLMDHHVFTITNEDFCKLGYNLDFIITYANELGQNYFNQGFQCVVAVHDNYQKINGSYSPDPSAERYHIHCAINDVSYQDSRKMCFMRDIQTDWQCKELIRKELRWIRTSVR